MTAPFSSSRLSEEVPMPEEAPKFEAWWEQQNVSTGDSDVSPLVWKMIAWNGWLARARLVPSETASRNAAPQEGAGSPAGPAANGELAVAAFINDLPIPEEFHALASFYDVKDLSSLVRMQQEHIEGLQAKLPPTPTFPGPQRVREG
jgi:hypothetical protein